MSDSPGNKTCDRWKLTHLQKGSAAKNLKAPTSDTYHEFIACIELCLDFLANFILRDTQVLPDVTVVAHQGHVVLVDVNQLGR